MLGGSPGLVERRLTIGSAWVRILEINTGGIFSINLWYVLLLEKSENKQKDAIGWEPWSSGYGRRLTFWRSWVRIPVPYTGWTFFPFIHCKTVFMFVWKRPKINEKEAGDWPIFRGKNQSNMYGMLPHMCCLIFGSLTKTQQLTTWANTAFISFN